MKKSIIIGSNGYIGHNLTYYLKSLNEEVYCFDIQVKSIVDSDHYSQLDITDHKSVGELDLNVDFIYFFPSGNHVWIFLYNLFFKSFKDNFFCFFVKLILISF